MLKVNYQFEGHLLSLSDTETSEKINEVVCSNSEIKISIKNIGCRKKVELTASKDVVLQSATDDFLFDFAADDLLFVNGYQSWTDSFEYKKTDKLRNIDHLPKKIVDFFAFASYGDRYFHKYDDNVIHGYDIAYVKGKKSLVVGSYNSKNAYLIIEFKKNDNLVSLESDIDGIKLKRGESVTIFDYFICDSISEGLDLYNSQFIKPYANKIFGYTSWYNHYQNINESIILDVLDKSSTNFDLFQIDDGYETYVGDWLNIDKSKFPNGLSEIVNKIHAKGMIAGIWLAPFAAEIKSDTYKNHKDWLVVDDNGNPVKAGANWSGFYALDINNPEVVEYIKKFLTYYVDLGFDFFKLDFLYAVNLGKRCGESRAQTAERGYSLLRTILGDKLILGCGGVMSTSAEKFDYMRIGPDVSLKFDDVWYMRPMHRERISTKITLRNTIYRSFLNGNAFLNDPDVFLLRDKNIWLTSEQKKALITINALFGSVLMTSDNPKDYDDKKLSVLNESLDLFKNAKNVSFETKNGTIDIKYTLNGNDTLINYNIEKGVLSNG